MKAETSSGSRQPSRYKCRDLRDITHGRESISCRHVGIPGFDQERLACASVTLVGAGGINGEIGEGLVRKGVGGLFLLDGDTVALSNLNRQRFSDRDIGKNKAQCLARNLSTAGFMGTQISALPYYFQEALERGKVFPSTLLACGVDSDECRVAVASYSLRYRIPVIHVAVSRDGNQGSVFIQQPDAACFGCAFPRAIQNADQPCPGVPAIKDILKVVAGISLYAIDTVLMERERNWNYRVVQLAGFMNDTKRLVERKTTCPLCSVNLTKGV